MKKILFLLIIISIAPLANAVVYLDETFNYADFTLANSGWTTIIVPTPVTATRTLATPALIYYTSSLAYINSGIGNTLNNYYKGATGASFTSYKPFNGGTSVSSPVYLSFLYKIQAQGGTQAQIIGLTSSETSTSGIHVWNKGVSATSFRLGITRVSTTSADIQWYPTDLDASLTYLIVVKYDGTTASLFVNPLLDSASEPTANAFDDGKVNGKATTITTLSHLIIRGNGGNHVYFYAGGIRVSSSWAEAVASTAYTPPVSSALPAPTVGAATNLASNQFTASWTPVENAIGYTVKVYWGNTFVDSTTVSGQATSSTTVGRMVPDLTYTYKVIAKGNGTTHTNSELSTASSLFTLLTASIPSNNLKIILKLDDLGVLNSVFAAAPAFDFMKTNKIKWGAGAIANRLDATSLGVLSPYINALNAAGDTLLEVWHHGYDHSQNNPVGTWEFSGRSYADQKASFDNATQVIKTILGIQMHSFGTPYNQSDAVTNTVIGEDANFKVMMFSKIKSTTNGVLYLENRVNMESATGSPEYSYFRTNYDANKNSFTDYMILQGHPNYYTTGSNSLEQFKLILQFLISEGVEFVRPYDYYKSTLTPTSLNNNGKFSRSNLNFSIFPNPCSGNTTLSFEVNETKNLKCVIYNLAGSLKKQVFNSQFNNGINCQIIDVSQLQSGVYICQINDGNSFKSEKLIVNRE